MYSKQIYLNHFLNLYMYRDSLNREEDTYKVIKNIQIACAMGLNSGLRPITRMTPEHSDSGKSIIMSFSRGIYGTFT